ncbi:MAG: S8 family serine peptidase [Thermoplasmatota archaeon]
MRRFALLFVVILLAVPTGGCLENLNPLNGGFGPAAWPLTMTQITQLQNEGRDGSGVKIAVIDTGIDANHPEFAGLHVEWADLVNNRPDPYDDNGHGTHVAGILEARGNWKTLFSGFYLQGVARGADLIVIKAIGADGKGDEATVARAVDLAVQDGADVIVLSLGGGTVPVFGTDTERAVNDAVNSGVFVVAAAGNAEGNSTCEVTSPASVPHVIAVGAVDSSGTIASFSCQQPSQSGVPALGTAPESDPDQKPEVIAPGVNVLGAWCSEPDQCTNANEYVEASGTSQAAPFVGGIIALVLQGHPELRRSSGKGSAAIEQVKQAIMVTSEKIGPLQGKSDTSHDPKYGYGLIQAKALDDAV